MKTPNLENYDQLVTGDTLVERDIYKDSNGQFFVTNQAGRVVGKNTPSHLTYYRMKTPNPRNIPKGYRAFTPDDTVEAGDLVFVEHGQEWMPLTYHSYGSKQDNHLFARAVSPFAVALGEALPKGPSVHVTPLESGNPKDAIGDTKPDLSLVPPALLIHVAGVMELGAKKYGPYNWRENKVRYRVYLAAALRHLQQALDRDDIDPESGQPHLAHAAACCGILLDAISLDCVIDDRPTPGAATKLIKENTKIKK